MTDLEKELLFQLSDLVAQNFDTMESNPEIYETGFIRAHKTTLETLVRYGVMVEDYPEKNYSESPYRVYYAHFSPNWKIALRDRQ